MPVKLAQLLELEDKPVATGEPGTIQVEDLESTPRVRRRHIQLRAGHRGEIVASGIYAELPVLMCDADGVRGRTYPKAQGKLAVKAFPEPDGRVRLELVPELYYGETRQGYVGPPTALRLEAGKDRHVFDELGIEATLSSGDMLVLGSLPSRRGSLGDHFLTQESSGRQERKMLVIRLSQTQHDDLFTPRELVAADDPK